MKKEMLPEFLEALKEFGDLWAPVKKNNTHSFEKIDNVSKVDLDYTRTTIPLKKFFAPPKTPMVKYDMTGYEKEHEIIEYIRTDETRKQIIFGAHPCDINGILILDKLFLNNYTDPYYYARRQNSVIIGHSCLPDENCLCKSTDTDTVDEGFDLFFTELDDYYLVWVGSSLGDDIIRANSKFFDETITNEDIAKYSQWRKKRDEMFKTSIDFDSMPDFMELAYNSEIWDELGAKCLSCGSCSMVCPTCNCYNVFDDLDIPDYSGERYRVWDSCMFKEYSLVAGGHNFREARSQRLKLYYTHKLKAYIGQYGKPSCVGCGRCIETCPVNINILTVAKALTKEVIVK